MSNHHWVPDKTLPPMWHKQAKNGKQMTVVWHADDIKVIHKSKKIFTRMSKWRKKTYDRIFEDGSGKMKVSRVNIHEYLGMILDFSEPG